MEKNIENLLFSLAEDYKLETINDNRGAGKIIGINMFYSGESIYTKLEKSEEFSQKIKLTFKNYDTTQSRDIVRKIVIDANKIKNFLNFSYQLMEKSMNENFIELFGMQNFLELKKDVLDILQGKNGKRLSFQEIDNDNVYNLKTVNLEDKNTSLNCHISFSEDEVNNCVASGAIRVKLHTALPPLEKTEKLQTTTVIILIPVLEMKKYKLLNGYLQEDIKEEDILKDLILDKRITCPTFEKFKFNIILNEKETTKKIKL